MCLEVTASFETKFETSFAAPQIPVIKLAQSIQYMIIDDSVIHERAFPIVLSARLSTAGTDLISTVVSDTFVEISLSGYYAIDG